MQHAVLDLLRAALIPELGADIATGAAGNVQLVLVAVAALGALPHQLGKLGKGVIIGKNVTLLNSKRIFVGDNVSITIAFLGQLACTNYEILCSVRNRRTL